LLLLLLLLFNYSCTIPTTQEVVGIFKLITYKILVCEGLPEELDLVSLGQSEKILA